MVKTKLLFLPLILLAVLVGCSNPAEETDYPGVVQEVEQNLPPELPEPEYIPQPAETALVRGDITNRTGSLTISDIEIVCADMQQPGGIHLLDTLPPEERPLSSRATIDCRHDVRFPAISFAYESDTLSGRTVFVLSDVPIEIDSLRNLEISVEFRERDWLFAEVRSNLYRGRGSGRTVTYRYFPEISQWLPAQDRQRLFVAEVEPDLLRELDPSTGWDSPYPATVIFTDEPIIDLRFLRLVSEDPESRELVLDELGDVFETFSPGQYIIAPYPLRYLYAQHRDLNGVVYTQQFGYEERGGYFPTIFTRMVDSSWSVRIYNEPPQQPPVYNSAFERAVESRSIRNIDESTQFMVIEYGSMSREELAQIENLERFDAGDDQRFVVIPRYEDSEIFVEVSRRGVDNWELSFEERRAFDSEEIPHRRQNTPQNYALVVGMAGPTSETTASTTLIVAGGGYRARHGLSGGWGDISFPLAVYDEAGSLVPTIPINDVPGFSWARGSVSVHDTPLANGAMLRELFPAGSDENGLSVIFDGGEVLELDGHMLFSTPRISPEGDMVANRLARPNWAFGTLYLLDVYAQTYRELEIDGMQDGRVPLWAHWLDNSHLLVGTAWGGDPHREPRGSDIYVYIVEEDTFFKLFESGSLTRTRGARVYDDRVVVEYAVAVCFGFRDNFYEERERVFPLSEIHTLIAARQAYVFEWDVQLGLCEWIDF